MTWRVLISAPYAPSASGRISFTIGEGRGGDRHGRRERKIERRHPSFGYQHDRRRHLRGRPIHRKGRSASTASDFKIVCVIPFRRDFLHEFSQLAATPLEKAESIDMLRALEHGRRVHLVETKEDTNSVDTVDDLMLVEGLMKRKPQYRTEDGSAGCRNDLGRQGLNRHLFRINRFFTYRVDCCIRRYRARFCNTYENRDLERQFNHCPLAACNPLA